MLDLRKSYARLSKPALWVLLEKYGWNVKYLESLMDLHEFTEYKVRGKEGVRETWRPARGLREGCSTYPILFKVLLLLQVSNSEELCLLTLYTYIVADGSIYCLLKVFFFIFLIYSMFLVAAKLSPKL